MVFDERLILENKQDNIIYNEHLVRYEFARQFVQEKEVLDIACGSGYGTKILAKSGAKKVTGIDISEDAVKIAQEKYSQENIKYITANAEDTKQIDHNFDLVVSFETIEHLKNADKFLQEIKRITKPDGLVFISTPNREVSQEKNPYHLKEYNKQEFQELINKYFKYYKILDQSNGLASCISVDSNQAIIHNQASQQPLYFIAICSQSDILNQVVTKNFVSLNYQALERIYKNPIMRLSDKIYPFLTKIPIIKKIINNNLI